MTPRERLLKFLREPETIAQAATDPDVWREGLLAFAVPSLESAGAHPLREAQVEAWNGLAEARMGLVLGPPGTGKTYLLSWLILGYIHARRSAGLPARVFVSAFTRNAIGNLLDTVAARAAAHGREACEIHFVGNAPPAGLSSSIQHRPNIGGAKSAEALADIEPEAVVLGGSVWSLYRLLSHQNACGDGFTADLFDLVCIDEASQVVLTHGLMALAGLKEEGRVVVAGDDRQLPPIRSGREVMLEGRELGGSLYAFLKSGGVPEFALEETFRLNGPLAAFPQRKFYPGQYSSAVATERLNLIPDWKDGLDDLEAAALDPDFPIAILLHDGPPAATSNEFEAELAAGMASCLADRMPRVNLDDYVSDLWRDRLAIVSPHRAQNTAIRHALPESLRSGAFVETVDRIQGKERDAVVLSYCVSDAEFALAEAEFIFSPERLNVAITRARTKLIVIVSRRLLDAVPTDQKQMDNAELLREFVFAAEPAGERHRRDGAGAEVKVQLRLLGFANTPVLAELDTATPSDSTPEGELSRVLEDLLEAVKVVSLNSPHGNATESQLKNKLATRESLLPGLAQLHARGQIALEERSGQHGLFWTARSLDPVRRVFAVDPTSVRRHVEEAISQSRSGRLAPFYNIVRNHFAWMDGSGADVLKPEFDHLKDEGLLAYGTARNGLTVEWSGDDTLEEPSEPVPPLPLFDDDFRILNALEEVEAARINFGVFEGWTSAASLADEAGMSRDKVTAAFGRLAAASWIMLAADGRSRSRMAELAREVRYVKQRFNRDDADRRPYLVRSIKIELRDRDKPDRCEAIDELFHCLAEEVPDAHAKALTALSGALRGLWGAAARLAAFQARSITALTRAWQGGESDAFVVAADTGSGKTEAAALPLIAGAAADRMRGIEGTRAIFTYPRVRLATNQAQRLVAYLARLANEPELPTVTLGLQIAQVPESFDNLHPRNVEAGWNRIDGETFSFPFFACPSCGSELVLHYGAGVAGADKLDCIHCDWRYKGWVGSKKALRANPPGLFLPTTDSLHQWLHDPRCGKLFGDHTKFAPPRIVVADEIHLYTHVHGAQVGYALRRLAARAELNQADANGNPASPMLAVGMSATLGNPVEAWSRLIERDTVALLAPNTEEKSPNPRGREYFYFVQPEVESRGHDIAGASTTIQTVVCLAHGMRRRTGKEGGFRTLAFLDSIDKIRRLHANYDDAETHRRLARYRTWLFADDPMTCEPRNGCCGEPHGCDAFRDGECWYFAATDTAQQSAQGLRRPDRPLLVANNPVFSGTSGRVEALIKSSDIVFATSSLEVGYDDPDIALVYQHYAPQNLASFIQRKGRGGRGSDDRPLTGVTLSIYSSRDSWWFRQPHEMIEPSNFDIPLNPNNHFVRRGQILATMLDALARYQFRANTLINLSSLPETALEEAEALVERVFGPEPWIEFDQTSLIDLWERALDSRRNGPLRYPSDVRGSTEWIPDLLFDTVNVPRIRIRAGEEDERFEDVAMTLAVAAPGNATRRYDGVAVYWRPPVNGRAPWLARDDYASGQRPRPFGNDAQDWLNQLPDDVHPLLDGLLPYHFRPTQLTFETLGRMHGTGWLADWAVPESGQPQVASLREIDGNNRRVRHDARALLRGYPVVKAAPDRAQVIDPSGLTPWVQKVETYFGDGVGGRTTGLGMARVFWGADAELPLVGPPSESVNISQIFTDPETERPMLHGYHVQTEGVRYTLNIDFLDRFIDAELERLKSDEVARRWHAGQMLRFSVECKAQAAGVNAYEARRGAELLVTAAADPDLRRRLFHLLRFWSGTNLESLFEDTRSKFLSQHPLLSLRRVNAVARTLSDQRFQSLFDEAIKAGTQPITFRRYLKSVIIHSLAARLKDSFVQVGRADERQVVMHLQLPIQFSKTGDPTITLCEAGSFGDGTTRSFRDRFDESVEHWRDGFIDDCPNAREDLAMRRFFENNSLHETWRALEPNSPAALATLAEPLGVANGTPIPPAVLRVLFGIEEVGIETFELFELAHEVRQIDDLLASGFGRAPSAWELCSAVVDRAKEDESSILGRLLRAYAKIEAAAQDDSLSPEARLADQIYRLNVPLCVDGCRACVHQASDLMTDSMVEASTSRTLLQRCIEAGS